MDGTSRILFVVEGEKTERQLVNRLSEAIVPVTELGEYKKRVAKRRLVRFHIE